MNKKTNLSDEDILNIAKNRVLPPGYKPEDYSIISNDISIRIAKLIYNEFIHIKKVEVYLFTIDEIYYHQYTYIDDIKKLFRY